MGWIVHKGDISEYHMFSLSSGDIKDFAEAIAGASSTSSTSSGSLDVISADTTINVASSGGDYASVVNALSSLDNKFILPSKTVTIEVDDGTYTENPIFMSHPQGNQITIKGKNTHSKSMTSVQSSSGSSGNWSIVINLSDVNSIVVGDYMFMLTSSGGTYPIAMLGCHEVTNVDSGNSRITVATKTRYANAPSGNVTGTVTILKTILYFPSGHGVECGTASARLNIKSLVLKGNAVASKYGVYTDKGGWVNGTTVGAVNFYCGFCSQFAGGGDFSSCIASGNSYAGFAVWDGANMVAESAVATGSGTASGFDIWDTSYVYGKSSYSIGNAGQGYSCGAGARIYADSANAYYNASNGFYSNKYGYIYCVGSSSTGNGTAYSPNVNTQGNEYGYNDT